MSTTLEISSDAPALQEQNGVIEGVSLPEQTEAMRLPKRMPRTMEELIEMITVKPGESNGWAEIVGKWPGDETDAEIDAALAELS